MIWDSNIIIYSAKGEYPFIKNWAKNHPVIVSAVSYLEVLGYNKLHEMDEMYFRRLFSAATVIDINASILQEATYIRHTNKRKMSIGDALIAATALFIDRPLLTRNTQDFGLIPGLQVVNPFENQVSYS
jgi:predicted nucleic acid-binding protein